MAFDPDTFLAESQEFNPDAFLGNVPREEPGLLTRAKRAFTGEERMTPTMESIDEIGHAPELDRMSVPAFKASLGLLSTGETEPLKNILKAQYGKEVSFSEDEKGNVIVNLPSGQYALNKPGLSPQDAVRGVFDALAFTPAGKATTIPLAIGKSALTEAAIEGVEASVGGDFDIGDVVAAGALGGAMKGLEDVAGAGYRALKGKADDSLVTAGKEAGIPVMTSDVIQPETFAAKMAQQTGEKIPLAGTGAAREAQQALRERAVNKTIEKYGEFSYSTIVESLKTQKNKVKNAAGSVLEAAGRKLDDIGEIPITNTREAIKKAADELQKKGVIKSTQAMDDLDTLIKSIDEAPQTFSTLKENSTAFREIVSGADKADRTQLSSRAKSLLQSVQSSMRKDMTEHAKANLPPKEFMKWQKANKVYAEEAVKLTKTRLKNVLDKGDITPEAVQSMLFSQKPSEVKSLYKSLTPEGRSNARSAIISKAVNDLSRRASGITPNSFASEMKKYGIQTNEFFKGEEKRQLNGLLRVLSATRRAQDAAITTPTGQQVIGAGSALALFTNPVETIGGGGTLGGLARLYESAPVRNALLRLGSIPKGSTRYEKALSEAFQALNAGAQTARERITEE